MAMLAALATVAGTAVSALGTIAAGKQAEAAAGYEAQQLEIAGDEEQAAAAQERDQIRRKKELALSSLTARAAASGFSASDPTALDLAEDIERYGTVQEQMAMYGGRSRKAGRVAQAEASRMTGRAARQGAAYKAVGIVLSGVGTLADRYNPAGHAKGVPSSGLHYGSGGANSSAVRRTTGTRYG